MRLLVTGGAGFIGSNFIAYVLGKHLDWEVVNIDKLTYAGNLENLRRVEQNPRYTFVRGDITSFTEVADAFERWQFDAVVNFAAESHVDRSIVNPAPFVDTNVKGTQVLLEASRQFGISLYVQISTDEVYGSLGPDDPPFTEGSPLLPNNPYAASKAAADLLARSYFRTYGVPVIITRCCNNYGPFQFPEKFIPLTITNALCGEPIPVYGDGLNIRDWIHVEDHCRAIESVILRGCPGETYNIGAMQEFTNLDLALLILRMTGCPPSLLTFVRDRPAHDRRYAVDSTKLTTALGWRPVGELEDALPAVIEWYRSNEAWWRPLKQRWLRVPMEAVRACRG